MEKVNQTDPLDGIIAELESNYDTFESDGDKEMMCLYKDLIKFMEENNWLNASKDAIINVIDKYKTDDAPSFYKL